LEAVIAGRQRHCAGGCNAVKSLGLFDSAERPMPEPQTMGKQNLSLRCGSGVFQGQWDVRVSNAKSRKIVQHILVSPRRGEEETKTRILKGIFPW